MCPAVRGRCSRCPLGCPGGVQSPAPCRGTRRFHDLARELPGHGGRAGGPMTTERPTSEAAEDGELREFGYQQELRRSLTLRDLLVYGLVFMVPIAPFAIFGVVFNASMGMVPLTYVIGFVAMIFTALSYREMSRAFPISGSVYAYAGRGLHPAAGFLAGWAILLDYL